MDTPRPEPNRREILEQAFACAGCALLEAAVGEGRALAQDPSGALTYPADQSFAAVPARHYQKLPDKVVSCGLCPNHCQVAELGRGACGVRENRGGEYFTLVHSRAVAASVDPIEKKPFFHYRPGTTAFSFATAGCNMHCQFCQNWQISQQKPEDVRAMRLPPARVHELARAAGAPTIAYTYNEPTVQYEYMFDTAELGKKTGIRSVVVTNGMIEAQPQRELLPLLDAVRIDLKSFRQEFYARVTGGQLRPVLRSIEAVRAAGKWLEIIVLVVPTMNDGDDEIRDLARWVKTTLGTEVPLHFTRFHPAYRLRNLPSTPVPTLERCHAIARAEGLDFVYLGNVAGHAAENTTCPGCHELLIARAGLSVQDNRLQNGHCPRCRRAIPGVWS
jgi:pyruvate formate lyase activating enzyme